ncbi:MAG: rubredoxin domain-containing protein [Bacteroidota bacterium]
MEKIHSIKINLPGGVVAAGDLLEILDALKQAGINHLRFGTRQQLFIQASGLQLELLEHEFFVANINFEVDADLHPNILSSYVSQDIFGHPNWMVEGVYNDVLDLFDYKPRLKVNLINNNQSFVPFFTGNFNFIVSNVSNYWHLHIRFPKTNIFYVWPDLVYTEDIALLSKDLEEAILTEPERYCDQEEISGADLYRKTGGGTKFIQHHTSLALELPDFSLPYYEGFNRYDNNKFWLGIYRRDELFSCAFLEEVCTLCIRSRIAQFYITPWKSIILKGIEGQLPWNTVLARHRINVRHASNELNWQIEDQCQYGLDLKQYLVRQFDQVDLRTFKLSFAIKVNPKTGLFGSVVIRKQLNAGAELFDILHTRNFNPNSKDFVTFRADVGLDLLTPVLISLCDHYYDLQTRDALVPEDHSLPEDVEVEGPAVMIHQCKNCLSVYDEAFGDEINEIAPGLAFEGLPDSYGCPICGSAKADFLPVSKYLLMQC